jgi:hypothetical protein
MHKRLLPLALSLLALAASAATAQARSVIPSTPTKNHTKYVNPFSNPSWELGRIDMGVDWAPVHKLPVLAVGDAVILGSDNHSGWPAGHIIWYQLLDGTHAGDVIYVAEHLRSMAKAGRRVHAGQRIAYALPGYPYIEMGWADTYGSPRAYPCYKEGHRTNSGKEMARFLGSLGADVAGERPGRGSNRPSGRLC